MTTFRDIAGAMIAEGEGVRLAVYDDATGEPLKQGDTLKGHPTIGYGRNLAGKGISEAEAHDLLMADMEDAEDIARGFVGQPVWQALSDVRRAVLMDMAHNLGAAGLYRFAKLRGALERNDFEQAAREIEDSAYFRQVKSRGERNRDAMRSGEWVAYGQDVWGQPPKPRPNPTGKVVLVSEYARTKVYWTGTGIDGPSSTELLPTTQFRRRAEELTVAEVKASRATWRGLARFKEEPA